MIKTVQSSFLPRSLRSRVGIACGALGACVAVGLGEHAGARSIAGADARSADGQEPSAPRVALEAGLEQAFLEQGIRVDVAGGTCAVGVEVCVRGELLEYVLVAPNGAAHESLFATGVRPSLLNTALLALGVEPGTNVAWVEKDPPPEEEALRSGASPFEVVPPSGDGFRIYVAWQESGEPETSGDEVHLHPLGDLINNLRTGRSMRRHRWVFLASRMVRPRPEADEEVLAADLEGNLINLSYFRAGNTLLTASLDDCVHQTIWMPNSFLVPERGARLMLIFSRERLERLPVSLAEHLPRTDRGGDEPGEDR
ncbi:MAG: hypothetical protein CMJ84_16770 [Planctomycetes bacterium]|jgi:hypothetical protein|nr:hypothetical protein [Planctomycetota bacterium]MDP6410788.1 YdjY domain-containing protein [Planctomycetota bacterium]